MTTRHAHRFVISRWDKIREIRLHIISWLGGVGLLIAIVGLQIVWFQQSYITRAAVGGGTYAEAVKGPIQTLNPLYATTSAELSASHLLFSSLYEYDSTGRLKGDIATTMTDEGDKVFTVKLRKDAKWHDGQKLTAADVVYTVGLMKQPAVRAVQNSSWRNIDAVQMDDYTVKFTLPAAYAAFPQGLTFGILPKHILGSKDPTTLREATFSTSPVGSGPFTLRLLQVVNQMSGRKIVHMDANKNYYLGRPLLDHMQLHVYRDDESIGTALRTGEVTGASDITSEVAAGLDRQRYNTIIRPENDGVYAIFNTSQTTLKDPIIRRALQAGTDTSKIRSQIFGNPRQQYLPFIADQVPGSSAIPAPKYDFTSASKTLEEAGWVMKDGVRVKGTEKLRLRVVTRKNVDYETALQVLVGQWRKLGVEVTTQIFDTSDATQNFTTDILQQRNYDVLLDELVIGGDPDVFAYWHTKGLLNFSNYSNQTSDDDLVSARTRSDDALRAVKYIGFAKQWLADAPAIGLYQTNYIYMDSKPTQAVQQSDVIIRGDDHYANVRYWTANEGIVYKTP